MNQKEIKEGQMRSQWFREGYKKGVKDGCFSMEEENKKAIQQAKKEEVVSVSHNS